MSAREEILPLLPEGIRRAVSSEDFTQLEEIRLRAARPITVTAGGIHKPLPYRVGQGELEQTLHSMSGSSVYAYIEEIRGCFITLEGGHRAGLSGTAVIKDSQLHNLTHLSGINLRVARQVIGAADSVMPYILDGGIRNTLIVSPPQCGKTTILRDIARQLGRTHKISVIDERGEIAAVRKGVPQHDIGDMTDVLDLCPKSLGIPLMLRSMSPDVIITDEIAECDVEAVRQIFSCGVRLIATAHGDNAEQAIRRIRLDFAMSEIDCVITLSARCGAGTVEAVKNSPFEF